MRTHIVTFLAYNRPDYFRDSVHSWHLAGGGQWPMGSQWRFRLQAEPSRCAPELIETFTRLLPAERIAVNPDRLGVAGNPFAALDRAFEDGADFAVNAEDDVVVGDDVLRWLDDVDEMYRDDPDILWVCTRSKREGTGPWHVDEVERRTWFEPLVYATWPDRWARLRKRWLCDRRGFDWAQNKVVHDDGAHAIFPVASRARHIGKFGGTHMLPERHEELSTAPGFPGGPTPPWSMLREVPEA